MANDKRFIAKNGLDNNSKTITNVTNPTNAQDAATKSYVDAQVAATDNYGSWTLYTDGTTRGGITSGEIVNFAGGTNVTLSYNATNNTITINSTDTDTVYTLLAATSTTLGGIELFSDTVQSVAANAVSATASRTYGVQLNSAGQAVVNIPWTNTTYSQATSSTLGLIKLEDDTVQSVAANAVSATASRTYGVQVNSSGQLVVNVPWVDTNTNTTYSAGSGITLTGTTFSNAAPDQTVTLTGSGATSVSGTYPNFTISSTDSTYTLPAATSTALGGIELFSDTVQSVAANAVSATASRTYGVQVNSAGQAVVNVPWVDTNTWRGITDTPTNNSAISISAAWAQSAFVGATVSNDTITFTKGDGTTTSVTTSDANTNYYVTGGSFDAATQVLTLTRNSGSATVDLSGLVTSAELSTAISDLVNGADAAYDTLKEIQDAMATDAELSAAIAAITIGNGTVTVNTGSGLTGSGSFTMNQTGATTVTLSHADTSTAANLTASSRTYVSGLTFDTYGHVTGYTTGTETVVDTNTTSLPVENSAGTVQFTSTQATGIQFAGSGATSVAFDAANQRVTFSSTDTNTTYSAGTGLSLSGTTFNNTAPDQTVTLTGSGATSVSGTYPNFTISSTDTNTVYSLPAATSTVRGGIELFSDTVQSVAANAVSATASRTYGVQVNSAGQAVVNVPWVDTNTNTTYSAGTGLSLSGTTFNNTAPDQTVTLTGSGATSVSGTYPNFTISSTDTNTVYTLPAATSTALGGIELFSDTVQSVAANAVTATASRTYGVQVNSAGQAVVNVPWVDTNTNTDTKITTSNDTTNATRYVPFVTTAAANQAAQTNTAFTFNPGTATLSVTNITGTSSAAKYSDIAERYETDGANEAGTIMIFGGDKEVTASTKYAQTKIAGVISTAPAYMMNSEAGSDETHPYIALQGRVPCKVVGKVHKGDIIVASEYAGVGQAWANEDIDPRMTAYVGIAIEDKDSAGVGLVEIKVGK